MTTTGCWRDCELRRSPIANADHVRIVKRGAEAIAEWRQLHPKVVLDLSWADLFGAKLAGANLSRADLRAAKLNEAFLAETDLTAANLSESNLGGANLSNSDLTDADLSKSNLMWANLTVANLTRARLTHANLSVANLTGANLTMAELDGARLRGANLFGANLASANLYQAELVWANFSESFLLGANLTKAVCHTTTFADCNLHEAQGLESVVHSGPSSIGIDTLMRMKDNLHLQFLQGAGVPESIIRYVSSPEAHHQRFYTCFISHCSADAAFADWLYQRFLTNKVRCWKYDESEVIGRPVWGNIGRASTHRDKVVIICSKDSLEQPAVQNEIERALQKEAWLAKENHRRADEGKSKGKEVQLLDTHVLFPVRLDDYLKRWKHERRQDLLQKEMYDFTGWESKPKEYEARVEKLLKAIDPEAM